MKYFRINNVKKFDQQPWFSRKLCLEGFCEGWIHVQICVWLDQLRAEANMSAAFPKTFWNQCSQKGRGKYPNNSINLHDKNLFILNRKKVQNINHIKVSKFYNFPRIAIFPPLGIWKDAVQTPLQCWSFLPALSQILYHPFLLTGQNCYQN